MKIVIINGAPRAGKDTFVEICKNLVGNERCLNVSTVDFVKEVARFAGWDGNKTPEARKFLSDLKDIMTEYGNIPFKKVTQTINIYRLELEEYTSDYYIANSIVFIHCREPQEIDKFKNELGAKTLLIRRPDVEGDECSNHADAEVFNYDYDYTIYNDGTLDDLRDAARCYLTEYLGIKI